ncbi:hypothetical protein [Fluviicola chungangensis]|uniref:hypothetical protein n=1 Tax=Fluviicola chungangensis TaxID=2597671 RepID=UPI001642B9EF|nr:hypothetical protein [Fluviicola chungangensis]
MKTNHALILTILGLLVISTAQIVAHYIQLPDFIFGAITGVGIGLMILAVIKLKKTISM